MTMIKERSRFSTAAEALDYAYRSGDRVRVWYGDPKTGKAWPEEHDVLGYVSRSTGREPIYILVYDTRSLGGGAIMEGHIVRLDTTSGHTLYRHPLFSPGEWRMDYHPVGDIEMADKSMVWAVYHDGALHARFAVREYAARYVDFMQGKRYCK